MKTMLYHFSLALVLLAGLTSTLRATVAFTITPAAISNTYNGPITLSVTGLTNTETVVFQKFLDANTNGVIDAGDLLWQQFNLTDGTNFVIGGVTNNNVPGDTDGTANGTITAKLNFQSDFLQTFDGKYLLKLSSPVGHFAPLTNSLTVTNFPYAQKFTGTVASNGVAVPNAVVILFPPGADGNPAGGTVANNSGIYTIQAPSGTYLLTAVKSNFVAVFETGPTFTLNTGATFITNLSLMAATQSISGKIVDANNSSLGLPGLLVPVQTRDKSLLALCITDTNGNFTARVNANQWGIGGNSESLAFHGYVGLNDKTVADTTTGSVSSVTIALPKATALFFGTVKDNLGNPLPGVVAIEGQDNNQNNNGNSTYQSDGYTDTNGNYATAVAGGLGGSDPWQVNIDNASSWPNYIFSQSPLQQNGGTNMTVGKVVHQNFTAIFATNHITGNVQFNGAPVSGVSVNANATISGTSYQAQADTDGSGNYSMNVANGDWSVSLNCNGGDSSLDGILGSGNYQCPDNQDVPIANDNGTANFTILASGGSGQIFGFVTDTDGDPVVGVTVSADDGIGDVFSTPTDDSGFYSFNVGNGNWDVSVDCSGLNSLGYQCVGDQNVNVSSGNENVEQDFVVQFSSSPLEITNVSLPNGNVGAAYSAQLNATGGQSPYNWALALGNPPPGLSLNSSGLISGIPTTNGLFSFKAQASDSNSHVTNKVFGIIINPKPVLGLPARFASQFQMLLTGAANQNYTVQMSTNLSLSFWTSLFVTNSQTTNTFIVVDPNATNSQRFYRILIGP
jgi:hypothetical protein